MVLLAIQAEGPRREGSSILKDYIRPKWALRPPRATLRFETAPRLQLQHDWSQVETVLPGERCRPAGV